MSARTYESHSPACLFYLRAFYPTSLFFPLPAFSVWLGAVPLIALDNSVVARFPRSDENLGLL